MKGGDVKGLAEGNIVFKSMSDPSVVAMGEIKADGSFVVGSLIDGKDYLGAPKERIRLASCRRRPRMASFKRGLPCCNRDS